MRASEFDFDARSLAGYQGRVNQSSQLNGFREKKKTAIKSERERERKKMQELSTGCGRSVVSLSR